MFKGKFTTELYEECLKVGFCKNHIEDLKITESESYEVQRKAFLYLRLQIFGPIVFRRPYPTEKMKTLFAQSNYFVDKNDPDKGEDFKITVLILDAIVTFTLCHFCKICCIGALFQPNKREFEIKSNNDIISKILVKKRLDENDIAYLVPSLRENFEGNDENFYKLCYVATLLLVRNVSLCQNLKNVVTYLDMELKPIPVECKSWNNVGMAAYKDKQYLESIDAYSCGLKYCPYYYFLLENRAEAWLEIKNYKESAFDSYVGWMVSPTFFKAVYIYTISLQRMDLVYECMRAAMYGVEHFKDQLDIPEVSEKLQIIENLIKTGKISEYRECQTFSLCKEIKLDAKVEMKQDVQEKPAIQKKMDSSKKRRSKVNLTEENKDIPELIEASDSESELEDVPDETDASDSDSESLEVNATSMTNCTTTSQTTQEVPKCQTVPLQPSPPKKDETEEKIKQLKSVLKEASQTLLDGCGYSAVPRYREALDEIKTYPLVHRYEECDMICIEYAFGVAYCKSAGYDDLQKAIAVFKGIAEDHDSINFPAVYYGIALAYYKLNRFKEAIHYLQIIDDILQKGIQIKVYTWPETTTVIEETKSGKLKTLVSNLLQECESPPPPDANCRFQDCTLVHSIYYTDPDFKGFFSIQCSDQCSLQFHPVCWRLLKTEKRFTDKEFLDQKCITPDCEGVIVKIENITKEGTVGKVFVSADTKKTTKKKSKLEKKLDVKEERRERRKRKDSYSRSDESKSESMSETISEQREVEPDSNKSDMITETNDNVKEKVEDPDFPNGPQIPVNNGSFIVFKKEKIVNENTIKTNSKTKENKKSKNTFSIDEFIGGKEVHGSEYQQRLNVLRQSNQNVVEGIRTNHNSKPPAPKFDPSKVANFPEPSPGLADFPLTPTVPVLPKDISYSEAVNETTHTRTPSAQLQTEFSMECTKKNTYSYLKNLLGRYGPLREDDPILINELQTFPGESNAIIADCGGLGKFLQKSVDFAFVGDVYVCLVDQIPQAYKKISSGHVPIHSSVYSNSYDTQMNIDSFQYSLNPEAKEYNPNDLVDRNSPSMISAISKLRQPLTVDEESASSKVASDLASTSYSLNGEASSYLPKQNELARMCLEAARAYFSDEAKEYQSYIDECLGQYSIVKVGRKSCRGVQTVENEKESKGTMKTDDELERLKQVVSCLTEENVYLKEQTSLLGEQCNSALDNATKCQKKSTVELAHLKKELEDANAALEEQSKESKNKEIKLEKEIKQLSESLKKGKEEHSIQKAEIDDLQVQSESLKSTLKLLEERVNLTRNEKHIIKTTLELQQDKLKDKVKSLEEDRAEVLRRAQVAELKFLHVQKAEYIRNIDAKTAEASQSMKQLQDGLANMKMNPVFTQNFGALLSQIQNYIAKLTGIRIDFMTKIDEQINAVKNGTPLDNLESLEIKELPQIPRWTTQVPMQNGQVPNPNSRPPLWPPVQVNNAGFNPNQANPYFRVPPPTGMMPPNLPHMLQNQQALLQQMPPMNLNNASASATVTQKKLPPGLKDPSQPLSSKTANEATVTLPPNAVTQSASAMAKPTASVAQPVVKPTTSVAQPVTKPTTSVSQPVMQPTASVSQPVVKPPVVKQTTTPKPVSVPLPPRDSAAKTNTAASSSAISKTEPPMSASASSSSASAKKSYDSISAQALELDYNLKKTPSKNTTVPEPTPSASKPTEAKSNPKNSYEKLIGKLKDKYPESTQAQLAAIVKDFRSQKNSLSGLSMDMIINQIVAMVEAKKQSEYMVSQPVPKVRAIPNKGLVNKKIVSPEAAMKATNENASNKKAAWGASGDTTKWHGQETFEDCTICFDPITRENAYRVDCGHVFHDKCIKNWIDKKSDCPICRVHLLLPEDYPAL